MPDFGERLKCARKMAGMSQAELAAATGGLMTKQSVSKYEKGKMFPSSGHLLSISEALGVRTGYFYRISGNLENLEFRKKSQFSKKDLDRVKYLTLDFLERFGEIEAITGQHGVFVNPLGKSPVICDRNDAEESAKRLRAAWELGMAPVSNLMELLEEKGVRILEVDFPEGFDGCSAWADGIPVVAVNKNMELVRKRFTITHELAHLIAKFRDSKGNEKEKLCHDFAGAFLIPEVAMRDELGPHRHHISLPELKRVKGIYGISIMAIMVRAHKLGIISKSYYTQFFIRVRTEGWGKKIPEPGKYVGREYANRFRQLVYRAVAEDIVTMSRGAELMNMNLLKFRKDFQLVA